MGCILNSPATCCDLQDITHFADDLLTAAIEAHVWKQFPPAARVFWEASDDLIQSKDASVKRLGYLAGP